VSPEKKTTVQAAEAPKQSQEKKRHVDQVVKVETPKVVAAEELSSVAREKQAKAPITEVSFDINRVLGQIDPAKIKLAEQMGLPIGAILQWVQSVEARFNTLQGQVESLPQRLVAAIKEQAEKQAEQLKSQTVQSVMPPPQASPQGGSGFNIMQLLPLLGSLGKSGEGEMTSKMVSMMFEKTMMGMDLSNALTKAMIIKLAPSLADELTKTVIAKS